jgi:hypothetical protein
MHNWMLQPYDIKTKWMPPMDQWETLGIAEYLEDKYKHMNTIIWTLFNERIYKYTFIYTYKEILMFHPMNPHLNGLGCYWVGQSYLLLWLCSHRIKVKIIYFWDKRFSIQFCNRADAIILKTLDFKMIFWAQHEYGQAILTLLMCLRTCIRTWFCSNFPCTVFFLWEKKNKLLISTKVCNL